MNILYHHRTRAEDAQGIHITEIINAFKKLGHKVNVVGFVPYAQEQKQQTGESVISTIAAKAPPILYEFMEILYNIYGVYKLRKQIRNSWPDFIYERYALFNVTGLIVSKMYNIPLIEEVNAPLSREKAKHDTLILKRFAAWCEKLIYSYSFKIIVVSTVLKNIVKKQGIPEKQFVVIPNGVNDQHFNPDINGSAVKERFGLENKIVIGFVGWFRKWHGLEELLEVYAEQGMARKNIHILLVGDGPAFKDLMDLAKKYNILNNGVSFTGPVKRQNIPEYLAAFDIALQPDVTDYASPIKMFEYISMGKGVIAPNKENIIEILGEDYPGLFSAMDWDSMGKSIIRACKSRESMQDLCKKSYAIFQSRKYLWQENAKRTIQLLKS